MANNNANIVISIDSKNKGTGFKDAMKEVEALKKQAGGTKPVELNIKTNAAAAEKQIQGLIKAEESLGKATGTATVRQNDFNASMAFGGMAIGQLVQGLIGGAAAAYTFSSALSSAMNVEQQTALLSAKFGSDSEKLMSQIEKVAAVTPGDDSVLKSILTKGAMDANLTSMEQMNDLAKAYAGYNAGSLAAGKNMAEVQRDIKDYIFTGATGILAMDSIYRDHIPQLEKAATVQERINMINQLNKEHYNDILASANTLSNVWQVVQGNMEIALTNLGNVFLPTVKSLLSAFLKINDATGGWAANIAVTGTAFIGLGVAVTGILGSLEMVGIKLIDISSGTLRLSSTTTGLFGTMKGYVSATKNSFVLLGDSISNTIGGLANMGRSSVVYTGVASKGIKEMAVNFLKASATFMLSPIGLILTGIAAAAIAAGYALTKASFDNAAAMKAYNEALTSTEGKVKNLRDTSERYKNEAAALTVEKNKLAAAGKNTEGIEQQISYAYQQSAIAAERATLAENALKDAREKKAKITEESKKISEDYANEIYQAAKESGVFTEEQLANLDSETAALKEGNRLQQYGLEQKKRVADEGKKYMIEQIQGNDAEAKSWQRNDKARQDYVTGMGKLAQLEEDYMNAESFTDKLGIAWEQMWVKAEVDWTNFWVQFDALGPQIQDWVKANVGPIGEAFNKAAADSSATVNSYVNNIVPSIVNAGNIITGAFNNTVNWIGSGVSQISAWFGWLGGSISGSLSGAFNSAVSTYNWAKGIISGWIGTGISVATGAIDWARQKWNDLKNYVLNNPIVGTVKQVLGLGPAGPARGPGSSSFVDSASGHGINFRYENYAGHQKDNVWNARGDTLTGNCVDMTLGLMGRYGGSMISGTWNGGPHVWWQTPKGDQLDPARKAIDNTFIPPARGPGYGLGETVIVGDVIEADDYFMVMVEKSNARLLGKARKSF